MSLCCRREVIAPMYDPDDTVTIETEDGTPITYEQFPEADLVCPGCKRTWPAECDHNEITLLTPSNPVLTDSYRSMKGHCESCDSRVRVSLEARDVRVIED